MTLAAIEPNTILCGDVLEQLALLPAESVNTCVTSPPYWGLRDYGEAGQIGLEATPEEYVAKLVAVFREVRRVLRADATLWLNLGDSYASGGRKTRDPGKSKIHSASHSSNAGRPDTPPGLKPKDLVGIPWRVAFALQQPYYTGNIKDEKERIWLAAMMDGEGTFTILSTTSPHGSGNSYPPIAQIRMTSEAAIKKAATLVGVASPAQYPPSLRGKRAVYQWRLAGVRAASVAQELYPYLIVKRLQALVAWNHQQIRDGYETKRGVTIPQEALDKQLVCRDLIRRLNRDETVIIPSWMKEPPSLYEPGYYLRSDVIWSKPNPMPESVTDRPTKAHEYIFLLSKSQTYYYDHEAIKEPAQDWGTRDRSNFRNGTEDPLLKHHGFTNGNQAETGRNKRTVWHVATQPYSEAHFATFPEELIKPCILAGAPEGGLVLDPFFGSGTTGLVSAKAGRGYIGIELNPKYVAMAERRLAPFRVRLL
ncbi:MAG: hypothetical protein A3E01_15250 [Gammaproteobacteria bacterium RIFCSPHIGHO2_12_FULL_63_22]|nr:MAG: hypothetical protein A3E01_15250 [Gammaproteobacteria bacterium RIFCSPHIGHO2_12_FULL_63_22]